MSNPVGQTREGLALYLINTIEAREHPNGGGNRTYLLDLTREVLAAIDRPLGFRPGTEDNPARIDRLHGD